MMRAQRTRQRYINERFIAATREEELCLWTVRELQAWLQAGVQANKV